MKKYFSSVPKFGSSSSPLTTEIVPPLVTEEDQYLVTDDIPKHKEDDRINVNEFKLESDPCLRNKIRSYPCNFQDYYRRTYWLKDLCQPILKLVVKEDGSIELDIGDQAGGETFIGKGFTNWKNLIGIQNNLKWIIIFRLCATIDCIRFLLKQGLAFRGHDESEDSDNRGNFLELLEFFSNHKNEVEVVVLKNTFENLKLVSPAIQKDIVNVAAIEILNVIINDIGDECFSILVDESRDVSIKEQMAVVVRYVNAKRHVIESFLGLEHVTSTTAISLKEAIETLFSRHKLSISKLRGQGYDGASNMWGEFNGLKTLILKENPTAYYVHYFAHQLL
ncbi:General transcription factor 2-related zinc finger protein [Actinidia rufa]|uniref:General transcription factor 2-related zinc finger protein n=1 Tax=Actinidia rufa TaxID=165716 RepID=A0A7J0G470_9ERIC|nr:General transcription factor 2-related zinc finger protein [Actinidia rufa]